MSASIEERIAEAVKAALLATPQIAEVADRVDRAREDSRHREEGESINIISDAMAVRSLSDEVDDKELTLNVEIYVRGDVWETRADAIAIQAHTRVMRRNYKSTDSIALARLRLVDGDWTGQEGDQTPGKRIMKYAFRYLAMADDITLQP
jgi:hypothetical protein